MTIAAAINTAIRVAKENLGDLVQTGTLRNATGKTYTGGTYTTTYDDVSVEWAPDKFSYVEMQAEDYVQTDIKILVFNPDNVLAIGTDDAIVLDGVQYAIRKVDPTYVGTFKPVINLVVRK